MRGKTLDPQINTVVKLADGLGVTIDELMQEGYQQEARFRGQDTYLITLSFLLPVVSNNLKEHSTD